MALRDPAQLKLLAPKQRGRKHGNIPVWVDSIRFDSKVEAARYLQLCAQQKLCQIKQLTVKPVYTFNSGIKFIPDFRYEKDGKIVIEDTKGMAETATFRMKRKLLKNETGLDVVVVRIASDIVNLVLSGFSSRVSYTGRNAIIR